MYVYYYRTYEKAVPYQATFYDRDHDEVKEDDRDDVIFFVEIDSFQSVLNFFAITGLSGLWNSIFQNMNFIFQKF